jgi:carbon storage regulator
MLVLRRKAGEAIVLNGVITIHVLAVEGERVKLGISAPPEVVIVRSELLEGQGQGQGPGMGAPGMPPLHREPPRPYREREPGGEGAGGYEDPRQRRDPNAPGGPSRFGMYESPPREDMHNGTSNGTPLPFRPNSSRYP